MRREKLEHKERVLARVAVDKNPLATRFIAAQARKAVLAKTRGFYPAPLEALEIVARAPHTDFEQGFAAEVEAVARLGTGRGRQEPDPHLPRSPRTPRS